MQMSNKSPGQGSLAIFFREGVVVEGRPQNHVLDHLGPSSPSNKISCWAQGPQDSGDGQHSAL